MKYLFHIIQVLGYFLFLFSNAIILAETKKLTTVNEPDSVKVIQILSEMRHKYASDKILTREDSISIREAIRISQKTLYISGEAQCFDLLGVRERNRSNYSKALELHLKALDIIGKLPLDRDKAVILNNIGVVYRRLDDFKRAADYHLQALALAENIDDIPTICVSVNSLGNIFLTQRQFASALKYFETALENEIKRNNQLGIAINLNNIGSIYDEQKHYKKAIDFINKSLEINKKLGSNKGIAICYNGLGGIFLKQNQIQKALDYFQKALVISESIGDGIYTSGNHISLGHTYSKLGNYQAAIVHYNKGLEIALSIGSKNQSQMAYEGLSMVFEQKGDDKSALMWYKKSIIFKDSIFNELNANYINRAQILYESGKKDKEIELLIYRQYVSSKKQKVIVVSLILGCLFLLILLLLLMFNARLKHQAHEAIMQYNKDIEEKNYILTQTKEEILTQRDEIEEKRNQINEAYELIKAKNNSITDNIHYALQIQNSLLPEIGLINSLLTDTFLFYKPKDIVSGDFYWIAQKSGKIVVAIADCTGHGVTGAFMSILGISALNEIVIEKGITSTNTILDILREKIIFTLQQAGEFSESREGIHMVVCSFDFPNKRMQFSGAINTLLLFRKGQALQYKGDKMPVSIFPEMNNFTSIDIALEDNDMIYMYSDGYYGQFGGHEDKKFSTYRFRSLLQKISNLPVNEQYAHIEATLNAWKGEAEQVDDILVMGIKV